MVRPFTPLLDYFYSVKYGPTLYSKRAGVVAHPRDWCCAGYHEIQKLRDRYVILDYERLLMLADVSDYTTFARNHLQRVNSKLKQCELDRDERWTSAEAGEVFS